MLKQQIQQTNDPLANLFQEGIQQFVTHQRQKKTEYVTRTQKHKEKIAKIEKEMNDPELKKQRNKERRMYEKAKIHKIIDNMSEEQLKAFMIERKKKKQEQREKVRNAMTTGQVFMLDLVYDDFMNGKEKKSLAKQIQLIMIAIKRIESPPSIHLCSFEGGIKAQLQKMGYQHWPIWTYNENIVQLGKKLGKKLVYLSPDAEQPLQKIEKDTAYILGGLIDRTIKKNASLSRAKQLCIQARRLPIRPFMKSRIVINLDHVVSMVCKYRETNDWKTAFDFAAPKRWKRDAGETKDKNQQSQSEQEQKYQKIYTKEAVQPDTLQ